MSAVNCGDNSAFDVPCGRCRRVLSTHDLDQATPCEIAGCPVMDPRARMDRARCLGRLVDILVRRYDVYNEALAARLRRGQ